jgi:hypothetical protein
MGGITRWDFLRNSLTDFSLRYVDGSHEVEAAHAEAASVFIHSLGDAEFLDSHPGGKPVATPSTGDTQIRVADYAQRKWL